MESKEPVWLLTWDQLARFGPIPVKLTLQAMARRIADNEPIPLHQEATGREERG